VQAVKADLLYTGKNEPPLRNVYIVFENTKIINITKEKPKCEIVDEAPVVTPAFIDAHSHIGLDRAGEPFAETEVNEKFDSVVAIADALDSVYMDDKAFKESIEYGVLYSCILPGSGNIIGGKAAVIRNYAETVDRAFIKYTGIKAALGFNPRSTTDWKGTRPSTRMGVLALFRKTLMKAVKEKKLVEKGKKTADEVEPEIEALFPLLEGRLKLRVHVHKADDVVSLIKLKKEFSLKLTADHCCDLHFKYPFELLKKENVPIVYGPVDAFPYKTELKHESWKNIKYLIEVKPFYGLMTDHPVVLQRNLFLQLRFWRRLGLSKEECISIITLNNAKILEVDNILGSIEKDKWASFILWNSDPFSLEAYPVAVYAEGKKIYEAK